VASHTERIRLRVNSFAAIVLSSVAILLAGLLYLNLRCSVYFDPYGSTVPLRFSFGWPLEYLGGAVPGPGQFTSALAPNYIWGHPEYNEEPGIMRDIEHQIPQSLPRTPWGLWQYANFSLAAAVLDIVIAVAILCAPFGFCYAVWLNVRAMSYR